MQTQTQPEYTPTMHKDQIYEGPNVQKDTSINDDKIHHDLSKTILNEEEKTEFRELLEHYDDIFYHEGEQLPVCKGYTHRMRIDPSTKPWKPISYRYQPLAQRNIDLKVKEMIEADIIEESDSEFISPIILVKRKNSASPRFVLDLRESNKHVSKDLLTPISLHDIINTLPRSPKIISSLDMKQAFYQILVKPEDRKYVAFRTRDEVYQLKRCPMGHKNSAQTLCRMLTKVLKGLIWRNVYCYLDDILLMSPTIPHHIELLKKVFQRFREHNLKLNAHKSEFCVSELAFLGYKISEKGLSLDPTKLDILKTYQQPTTKKEVKQYLGFVNFLRRSVPSFAIIATPLYKILRKDEKFQWTTECQKAFDDLNIAIQQAEPVQLPDYSKEFIIESDSSKLGVGCALLQRNANNRLVPIHFGSFRFNEREQKESITFQELLGCVMALKYFDKYIAYSKVILKTDHRPIVHLFSNYYTNSQISRFLTVFEKYDLHVMFTPGRTNLVADYLSRAHTIAFKELNLEKLQEYVDRMSFPDTKPPVQTFQEKIQRLKTVQHTNRFTPLNETFTKPPLIHDTEIDTPLPWHYNKPVMNKHANKNTKETSTTTQSTKQQASITNTHALSFTSTT